MAAECSELTADGNVPARASSGHAPRADGERRFGGDYGAGVVGSLITKSFAGLVRSPWTNHSET